MSVSAPPRVQSQLRTAPDGPVPIVHQGTDAVYVAVADRVVGVVGTAAVAVPCALRTRLPRLPRVGTAAVQDGVLHLDGVPLCIGRLLDVRVPPLRVGQRTAGPPPWDVATMIGRGDGLTPYGDDVLCGWLAVHRAAGIATPGVDATVRAHLHRTTLLSATLLDCALHGEAIPQFVAWLSALGTSAAARRTIDLTAVGHSSGRGLRQGALAALSQISPVEGAA